MLLFPLLSLRSRSFFSILFGGALFLQGGCERPNSESVVEIPDSSAAITWGSDDRAVVRIDALHALDEDHSWIETLLNDARERYPGKLRLRLFDLTSPEGREAGDRLAVGRGAILIDGHLGFRIGDEKVWFVGSPGGRSWTRSQWLTALDQQVLGDEGSEPSGRLIRPLESSFGDSQSLMVFSGAGLREPMEAARTAYEKKSGVRVKTLYAGSACLLAQIAITHRNRPADLYLPGEQYFMDQAAKRGFVAEQESICYFIPVIMVAEGNPKNIRNLRDLAGPGIRIGIGVEKATAVGKTSMELLEKHGLRELVERNIVLHAPTAPELGSAMEIGSIDAAINWDAVAAWYEEDSDVVTLDPSENLIVRVPLGLLSFAPNPGLARDFFSYLASEEGREIFRRQRYTVDLDDPVFPHSAISDRESSVSAR